MQLSYGGIQFPQNTNYTSGYDEQAKFSADGLVYEHSEITISVQTILSPQQAISMAGGGSVSGDTPAAIIKNLQAKLLRPRQTLIFADENGNSIVTSPNPGDLADVTGGPRTKVSLKFYNQTYILTFQVTTARYLCDQDDITDDDEDSEPDETDEGNPNQFAGSPTILSNRWSTTIRYDRNCYASREVVGVLRVNKAKDINPDTLRKFVTPKLPAGFVREDYSYTVEPGGAALSYRFADRQEYTTPPALPDGTRTTGFEGAVQVATNNGVYSIAEVHLKLEAPISVDPAVMLQQLYIIAFSYLGKKDDSGNPIVGQAIGSTEACQLTRSLNSNSLDFSWRVRVNNNQSGDQQVAGGLGIDPSIMLQTVPGSDGKGLDPGITAAGQWLVTNVHAGLSATDPCYGVPGKAGLASDSNYYDPDDPESEQDDQAGGDDAEGDDAQPAEPDVSVGEVDDTEADFNPIDVDGNVYTEYLLDSHYVQHTFQYVLPVAGSDSPTPPLVVQAAQPVWLKVVKWTAERMGIRPMLPQVSTDENLKLLKQVLLGCSPVLNPDKSSKTYRASGIYYYVCLEPPAFDLGLPPYFGESEVEDSQDLDDDSFQISDSDFAAGIEAAPEDSEEGDGEDGGDDEGGEDDEE